MYNLLLISDNITPYVELIDYFKKDFFNVYTENLSYLDNNAHALDAYDFIMLNLTPSDQTNENMIQLIKKHALCPLYLFSKNHDSNEKARLMELGAEGHLDIPFASYEVSSRIKAVLRYLNNMRRHTQQSIKIGKMMVNLDNREIHYEGQRIRLTNVEYRILRLLIENRDRIVSKDEMIRYAWDDDLSATDNALGIHMTRLRKKLKCPDHTQMIETVWGLGYRFNINACEKSEEEQS